MQLRAGQIVPVAGHGAEHVLREETVLHRAQITRPLFQHLAGHVAHDPGEPLGVGGAAGDQGHAGLRVGHVAVDRGGGEVGQFDGPHPGQNFSRLLAIGVAVLGAGLGVRQILQQVGERELGAAGSPARGHDGPQQLGRLDQPGPGLAGPPGIGVGEVGQRQRGGGLVAGVAAGAHLLEDPAGLQRGRFRRGILAGVRERVGLAHERESAITPGLRRQQRGGQTVVVGHRLVGELPDDLGAAGGLELLIKILEQETDELLGLRAGALRELARLGGLRLGRLRAAEVDPTKDGAPGRGDHEHGADGGHLPRATE